MLSVHVKKPNIKITGKKGDSYGLVKSNRRNR